MPIWCISTTHTPFQVPIHRLSSDAISPLLRDLKNDSCLGEALNEGALPQQRPSSVDTPRAHQGCAAFPFLLEGQGSLYHDNRGGNITWLGTLHTDLDMLIRLCIWNTWSACEKKSQDAGDGGEVSRDDRYYCVSRQEMLYGECCNRLVQLLHVMERLYKSQYRFLVCL